MEEVPSPDGGRGRLPRQDWRGHQPGPRGASSLQAGRSETGWRWRAARPSSHRTAESSRSVQSSSWCWLLTLAISQDKSSALRYASSSGGVSSGPVQYLYDSTLPPGWKCQKIQQSIYYFSPRGDRSEIEREGVIFVKTNISPTQI